MKLIVESQESGSRWELEIDADKQTVLDLLDSDEWSDNIESEFLSEDWNRKGKGFEVYGMDDDEISEVVDQMKLFFEEQGLDVEDIECITDEIDYMDNLESNEYGDDEEEEEFLDNEDDEELYEDFLSEEDADEDDEEDDEDF